MTSIENLAQSPLNPWPTAVPTTAYTLDSVFPTGGGVPRLTITPAGGATIDFSGPGAPAPGLYEVAPLLRPQGDWVVFVAAMANPPTPLTGDPATITYMERNGYYGDMWVATPDGSEWFNLTNLTASFGQLVGTLNPIWSHDGQHIAWASLEGPAVSPDPLADWHLLVADFVVNAGVPSLQNVRDITAPNSNWNEVLDWSPDGSSLLVSSDNNLPYDYGADDWTVNVTTGAYTDITNQPKLWDEHGSFSPTGKKVAHSQQIPPTLLPLDASLSYEQWAPLIGTEIWVSNADGSHAQQVTHFNGLGLPLSVGVTAYWNTSGTQLVVPQVTLDPLTGLTTSTTEWLVTFAGLCG